MHNAQELVADYLAHGWSLVPIPPGSKSPGVPGWNHKGGALFSLNDLPEGYGVGLGHAYSGTMAFDIDDWELTKKYGIDVDSLYSAEDAVIIHSGKPGHGKLLYKMPFGMKLPSKRVQIGKAYVDRKVAFELRCASADGLTVQDVLPPSIHPETKQPYQWAGKGNWRNLPLIPDQLLKIWTDLIKQQETTISVDGVDASWEEIQEALKYIPADCSREDWINVGMALHWAGTKTFRVEEALSIWNEWSWTSQAKYPGPNEILKQWTSFRTDRGTPVTLGTLYHIAREHGWVRPMPDASTLFSKVEVLSPDQIAQGLRPVPPDLDLSLFPPILRTRAEEVSESVGCDPLVPLFAGLAAVCGVVDARTRLELMPGFQVPPVLWLMTIGDPADKKSPGSRPMLAPLKNIEAEDRPRYEKEVLDWEAREKVYSVAKKAFLDFVVTSEAMLGAPAPEVPETPKQPVPVKITVSDITSQKLVRHAADRPRGLLCALDEMASWIRKLTDKTSGEDRSAWVVSYESERYEMDRVGAGSIHCDNLAVSIYGNIQPTVFRENIPALSADGLLQRFVPAVLRHNRTKLGNPLPEFMTHAAQWEMTLRLTFALPSQVYKLSPEAYRVFRSFQGWYEQAKQDERLLQSGEVYMTAFGKLEGLAGRLMLLFHVIESPFSPTVSAELVRRVIRIIQSYIIPAYRYAFGEIGGVSQFEHWLVDHVIQYCDVEKLTLSEIRRSARRPLDKMDNWKANQMVLGGMYTLEQAKWVARLDDGSKEHQGRAEWLINPALKQMFREYREKVIKAKQRAAECWAEYGPVTQPIRPRMHGIDDIEETP